MTGISGDCSSAGAVTLSVGDELECTVSNDDIAPKLTVIKDVENDNGGNLGAAAFSLSVKDAKGAHVTNSPEVGSATGREYTLRAGTYTVSEADPTSLGYAMTGISGDCSAAGAVTLSVGDELECTVSNDDIAPKLTVIKDVENDNGGTLGAAAFSLNVRDGNGDHVGVSPEAGSSAGTLYTLRAGTYTVSEDSPTSLGYAMTGISGDCSSAGVVTLSVGDELECTVTNDDIAPKLTVIKDVVNDDGGNLGASHFSLNVKDANGAHVANSPEAGSDTGRDYTLRAGTYTVSEADPTSKGYTMTGISGDCSAAGAVTLSVGDELECTITNDDIAPQLTVIKHVINDDGGTAKAGDFTMNVDDPGTNPASKAGAEAPGVDFTVDPGAYSVSESGGPSGYAESKSADCTGSIAIGETKTCTITNNDVAPKLTVVKHVINDDGGKADASDFTMNVDDPGTNPASKAGAEAPGVDFTVDPGAYKVTESGGPSGYAESKSAACDDSIDIGETKTCTITNNDIAPELTVVKHVVNDDGGTAKAGDFTMNVDDPGTNPASQPGAEAPGVDFTVDPGAYKVTESGGPAGYAESKSADCDGSIDIGERKTCTITNDDGAAKLTVIKRVVNDDGGTAKAGDFTMNVDDPGTDPASQPGAVDPGVEFTVDPGAYSVSESGGPSGYAASTSAGCAGSIAIGESRTCTITNDDVAPKLTVIKRVVNDDGGTAKAGDFTMNVDDPGTDPESKPGADDPGVDFKVDPGEYTVSESGGPTGYTASKSGDCTGSIGIGESKTCTITNDDPEPAPVQISGGPVAPVATPTQQIQSVTVASPRPKRGKAKLQSPTGCRSQAFKARVTGDQIASVTFMVDGKRVGKISKASKSGAWEYAVRPKGYDFGTHRLLAKVAFKPASQTKAKRLTRTFIRCGRPAVKPQFTG